MKRINIVSILIATVVYIFIMRACMNEIQANAQRIHKESFEVDYSASLGQPLKVEWSVSAADLGKTKRTPSFRFKADKETPRPRVTSALYTRSGYQRGHMCPAADRSATKAAMRATFTMSNVCPMAPALNTGSWKRIENYERELANTVGRCSVWAAPLFFPQDTTWIGRDRIAVPHAFMKVLFDSHPSRLYGIYICENL